MPEIVITGSYAAGLTMKTPRFPTAGETVIGMDYQSLHGGKGSNQAVGCARHGARVYFIACIGDDSYGHKALELYRREGVAVTGIRVLPDIATGVGFIMVNENGENEIAIDFGANKRLSAEQVEVNRDAFERADVLLMQMEIPVEPIQAAVALAKKTETISILNPAPYHPLPPECLLGVSILTPNETEAKLILGLDPEYTITPKELGAALYKKGINSSVITLGSRGMLLTRQGVSELVEAFPVKTVDTTGAGDAFTAALGVATAEGAELKEAAVYAAAAAALSTTRYGVIESLPTRDETTAFLHTSGGISINI
jgi:ribokinase